MMVIGKHGTAPGAPSMFLAKTWQYEAIQSCCFRVRLAMMLRNNSKTNANNEVMWPVNLAVLQDCRFSQHVLAANQIWDAAREVASQHPKTLCCVAGLWTWKAGHCHLISFRNVRTMEEQESRGLLYHAHGHIISILLPW